ncbi:MAG TPA: bifunctional hydroxymethylpyrimidine kinase/phosphomethylpyrimidine kinase [Chloroflexota bacterium]|nr:bifunctional hydroxymethylpyrimidine kinase/phosphomethylpyrimidine kinase [Chloroflexota bacterium]
MPLTRAQVRCVLSIAGSDSGGGAGLAADLKTFLSHGVHGTVAVTCVTAQNTLGVQAIQRISADLVRAQIVSVLDDLAPEVAKTGFLAGMEAIEAIETVADRLPPLVVDPVCVNKHGRPILDEETLAAFRRVLLPRAVLVTPNLDEAALLTGRAVHSDDDMADAAHSLLAAGVHAVLVKGGRLGGNRSPDLLLLHDGRQIWLDAPRVQTTAVHGTGDTLAAAIAARLAQGAPMEAAVRLAKEYVTACLHQALEIGHGQGPVGHVPAPPYQDGAS